MHRDPPKEWVDALGELGQPKAQLAHCEIWWDSDVHRWLLMECVPPNAVSDDLRLDLLTYPDKTPFRRRQSEAFNATGKIPIAFWIIQGAHGGHKLEYSEHDATLAQFYGGEREPPAPGSLSYAPFDNRVINALYGYDRLMSKFATLRAAYEGDAQAALEQMRRDMLAEIEGSLSEVTRDAAAALAEEDMPILDAPPPDYDAVYNHFITTGDMPQHVGSLTPGGAVTVLADTVL